MIRNINYDIVLCASRHEVTNPQGVSITESIFPKTCPLNVKDLNQIASTYLKKYRDIVVSKGQLNDAVLNVYVTGFSPALVALLNMRKQDFENEVVMVLWHYDDKTQAYTPQVVL